MAFTIGQIVESMSIGGLVKGKVVAIDFKRNKPFYTIETSTGAIAKTNGFGWSTPLVYEPATNIMDELRELKRTQRRAALRNIGAI